MSPEIPETLEPFPIDADVLRNREFRLGPNDVVRCHVFGHPELSTYEGQNFEGTRISPDGHLSLPLLGNLFVQDKTLAEARDMVTSALEQYVNEPKVEFSLLEIGSRYFHIYGDVVNPGVYQMERPVNVYEALTFGSGFRPTAKRDEIVLLRQGEEEIEMFIVNGEELEAGGLMDIRTGDLIFVMRSGSGRFRDEILPLINGVSASLSSLATVLLVEDRLKD